MKYPLIVAAVMAASPAAADQAVTINFASELGGQSFSCAQTYAGLGASEASMQVLDYRLFVSELAMIAADGSHVPIALEQDGAWQVDNIALLDFEDATGSCTNGTSATNMSVTGSVPEGDYTALAFTIGVPFDWNHGDPTVAPSPLNLTSMFWNWRGGYKFVKFEMSPVMADGMSMATAEHSENAGHHGADSTPGWFLHLGSTQCQAPSRTEAPTAACANPNTMQITLDGFNPATDTIVIDPAPVLIGADLMTNTPETSPGCMSFPNDPDCTSVLPLLGLPFNEQAAQEQVLVSVR